MSTATVIQVALTANRWLVMLTTLTLAGACVSQEAGLRGHQRIREMWAADNKVVLAHEGTHTVSANTAASKAAARAALERIGLAVKPEQPNSNSVVATRELTPSDISPAVNAAELPRVRRIMVEEIGPLGELAFLQPPSGTLHATVLVQPAGKLSEVTFTLCNGEITVDQLEECTIPTAQYRAGLFEFWRAFWDELPAATQAAAVVAKRRVPSTPDRTRRAMPAQATDSGAKPREVLPPSHWVLPQ